MKSNKLAIRGYDYEEFAVMFDTFQPLTLTTHAKDIMKKDMSSPGYKIRDIMKLATLKSESRDGSLLLLCPELTHAVSVPHIAPTLQYALENWKIVLPQFRELDIAIKLKKEVPGLFPLDHSELASPLPRAYQWAGGSAYVNHVELVRKARGAKMPESFWNDPMLYQGGSDSFLGPNDPIPLRTNEWGLDFESEIAVITSDVPMGVSSEKAGEHILLFLLVNDVSLRNLIPGELGKGFGFYQSKPSSSFSPAAVTPDEIGEYWREGKIHLPLVTQLNGELFGSPNAGEDMTFNFPQLISHAAKTRNLSAGTIIGSGIVSNRDRSRGSSCLAEKRMLELLELGSPQTPFLKEGDQVRIEMLNSNEKSIFGAINQEVVGV